MSLQKAQKFCFLCQDYCDEILCPTPGEINQADFINLRDRATADAMTGLEDSLKDNDVRIRSVAMEGLNACVICDYNKPRIAELIKDYEEKRRV